MNYQTSIPEPPKKKQKTKTAVNFRTTNESATRTSKNSTVRSKLPDSRSDLTTQTDQQNPRQQDQIQLPHDVNQITEDSQEDTSSNYDASNAGRHSPSSSHNSHTEVIPASNDIEKTTEEYTIPADFKMFFQQSMNLVTAYNLLKASRNKKLQDKYSKTTQQTKDFVKQLLPDKAFKSIFLKQKK